MERSEFEAAQAELEQAKELLEASLKNTPQDQRAEVVGKYLGVIAELEEKVEALAPENQPTTIADFRADRPRLSTLAEQTAEPEVPREESPEGYILQLVQQAKDRNQQP